MCGARHLFLVFLHTIYKNFQGGQYFVYLYQTACARAFRAPFIRKEKAVIYADLHCDYLSYLYRRARRMRAFFTARDISLSSILRGAADISGKAREEFAAWKNAECALQCFALFCPGESEEDERAIAAQLALFSAVKREFEKDNRGKAKRRAVLTAEGGGATGGNASYAAALFKAGVKIFSPVWNNNNSLCSACGNDGGLTEKGKDIIALALESGVLIDISHASDGGAQDMISLANERKKAVVATHSLARALCPSPRNLTDGQIKAIADSGGVAGVCFVRGFAGAYPIAQHIEYLFNAGGEDCVAIGGDFFGCDDMLVKNVSVMPAFFRALEKRFTPRQIEKFACDNAFRVLGICR